jgi:GWxTD domain-containing protein
MRSTFYNRWMIAVVLMALPFTVKAFDAHLSVYTFDSDQGAYAEICLYINANELERNMIDSVRGQSAVEYTLLVTNVETEKLVYGDRFRLSGPVSESSENFFDIRRFPVENGEYIVEYEVSDAANPDRMLSGSTEFKIQFSPNTLAFSSLQLLFSAERAVGEESRFVKSGHRMEVAPLNYFPPGIDQLYFYTEIYGLPNVFKEEDFYALGIELKRRGSNEEMFSTFSRRAVVETDVILRSLDISELGSGEYMLRLTAVNRDREELGHASVLFFRNNPILDEELIEEQLVTFEKSFVQELDGGELVYALKAITPVVHPMQMDQLNNILRGKKKSEMRYFLFELWCSIDPYAPENSYEQYMEVARAVDKMYYSGFGRGFETDRGRIFLKYGRPDEIQNVQTETDAPPYEVWSYARLPGTGQTDVQFIFHNPSLAGNMYELLHTNARGELNNPNWIRDLYRNAPNIHEGPNYHEVDGIQDGFNRRAIDIFTDN